MKRSYLVFIAAIVVAVVVFVIERPDRSQIDDFKETPLFSRLDIDKISRIEIEHLASGIRLTRNGDAWSVSELETEVGKQIKEGASAEKKEFRADREKVERLLGTLEGLKKTSLVSQNPKNHDLYQLGKLGKRLKGFDEDSATLVDFYIGKGGSDVFTTHVRLEGSGEVFLASGPLGGVTQSDLIAWRDRQIWRLDPDTFAGVTVKRTGGQYKLSKKEEGKWFLEEPEARELDTTKVSQFLARIADLKTTRFAAARDTDAKNFQKPSLELELLAADGNVQKLIVGVSDKQGYHYARKDGNEDEIYLLDSTFPSKIPSDWKELVPVVEGKE